MILGSVYLRGKDRHMMLACSDEWADGYFGNDVGVNGIADGVVCRAGDGSGMAG